MEKRIERHRERLAYVIAGAQVLLFAAWTVNRLTITVPVSHDLLRLSADNSVWPILHLLSAAGLVISTRTNRFRTWCATGSFGVLFTWSTLNLLWGIDAVRPVSIAGPILGFAVAGSAYLLADYAARGEAHEHLGK